MRGVFFIICLIVISCSSSEKEYKKEGVSFTIPAGWKISLDEPKQLGLIICERKAFIPKGTITISWEEGSLDLHQQILKNMNSLKKTMQFQHPKFDSIQECLFGGYKAICSNYKMGIAGVNSEGYYKCFYANNKTFTIQLLEGEKDVEENAEAKKKIASSFHCYQ